MQFQIFKTFNQRTNTKICVCVCVCVCVRDANFDIKKKKFTYIVKSAKVKRRDAY
jgi:hypothetical protein